jgi:DNA-binding MarR family transcriptional regulator
MSILSPPQSAGMPDRQIGGIALAEIASCTCFRLRHLTRKASTLYDEALRPLKLTGAQFSLLAVINGATETPKGLTIGSLARRAGLDATTLNRNLKPLEAAGYVKTSQSEHDRRRRLVFLSEAGRLILDEAAPLWKSAQITFRERLGVDAMENLNGAISMALAKI